MRSWISVSELKFGSRTNGSLFLPVVNFWVSNTGPRMERVYVNWFECKTKTDRTNLTPSPAGYHQNESIYLLSGKSTNVTIDIRHTTALHDRLACCCIMWVDIEPFQSFVVSVNDWLWRVVNLRFTLPFNGFTQHEALGASTNIVDYFYTIHGLTRSNVATMLKTSGSQWQQQVRDGIDFHGSEEWCEFEARQLFFSYCEAWPCATVGPELGAAPNTVPPHR